MHNDASPYNPQPTHASQDTDQMPATPHVEKHFTATETVRDIVIGMADGASALPRKGEHLAYKYALAPDIRQMAAHRSCDLRMVAVVRR